MSDLLSRIEKFVWGVPEAPRSPWMAGGLRVLRTVLTLARDLARGRLTLHAMGLVYTTLLSIVPLLALRAGGACRSAMMIASPLDCDG